MILVRPFCKSCMRYMIAPLPRLRRYGYGRTSRRADVRTWSTMVASRRRSSTPNAFFESFQKNCPERKFLEMLSSGGVFGAEPPDISEFFFEMMSVPCPRQLLCLAPAAALPCLHFTPTSQLMAERNSQLMAERNSQLMAERNSQLMAARNNQSKSCMPYMVLGNHVKHLTV